MFKIQNKTYGKIKNENDMLGFLISHMDSKNNISSNYVLENSGLENYSCNILIQQLQTRSYVIYSMDTITVTCLGKNNYVSPIDKILKWFLRLLKFAVSYTLGILSGVLIAYFIFKLGIPT